jgi:hypothetical protein
MIRDRDEPGGSGKSERYLLLHLSGVASFIYGRRPQRGFLKSFLHNSERGFYSSPLVCSSTLAGRKRVWGWKDGRTLARDTELYNSPSQGTGADLLKAVMSEVYSSLPDEVKMIGSVNDELILEAPEALAQDMASLYWHP